MKQGRILILSGPSGVGKGTVLKELLQSDPSLRLSVSATTRPMRPGDVDGVNYYFVTKERFEEMIAAGELLEYATYAGNYYGTPLKPVLESVEQGVSVVLEIEVQGALQVMKNRDDLLTVFIAPPSFAELKRRLIGRSDTPPDVMARRLAIAAEECEQAKNYQYIVVNDKLPDAVAELKAILTAEACRSKYRTIDHKEEI